MDIFKLVGSIFVDTEAADKSLAKTDEKAEGVGKKLLDSANKAGKFALGLGSAAAAGATALMGVATKSAETADEIDKMSQKMGISKEGYQEWSYVMGQNGMDISTLNAGMKTLVNQMESAANGSATASSYFEQLGISIYDASGNLKNQETIMNEAIYALADMEDMTMRSALATDLFGKAGTEMLPMLNSGSEGMQELTQRAHDLGLVMSDEAVNAGVVFGDTLDDVKQSFGMVVTTIGVEVMPIIQQLLQWVLANMPMIQQVFGDVFTFVGEVVKTAMVVIESLMPVISKVFNFVSELWNSSLKPALDNIISFIQNAFSGNFRAAFQNLVNVIKSIWSGIVSVVKSPLNSVISLVNSFISRLNTLRIPDWIPGFGGRGINISTIPYLAKGGSINQSGSAIVGEAGPELVELPVGARVTPLSNSVGNSDALKASVDEMNGLLKAMCNILSNQNTKIVLDTGVMVGELAQGMDAALGRMAIANGRSI